MPDDYHPPVPRRNPEDMDHGAIKSDLEFLVELGRAAPRGASAQAALHNDRERRDRHRLDRTVLAALPQTHADLLEPDGNRVAIRHRFHCHAVTREESDRACCTDLLHHADDLHECGFGK